MLTKIDELFNFENKTVVVTGGSMGIGFAIARRFAEAGASVVIADVDSLGKAKAKELDSEFEHQCLFFKTDVSDEKNVRKLFSFANKKLGKIDALVNNAGIYPTKPILEMELKMWEKTQAVNLRGTFLCCREAARGMINSGTAGSIVNITSVDALHPSAVGLASYDASKHGVWGFTKNFALEMAAGGIRVNAVAPGGIRTEGVEKVSDGKILAADNPHAPQTEAMNVPMKRMGEPDEIALATLFLSSPAASYVTGTMLVVDGGMLLK